MNLAPPEQAAPQAEGAAAHAPHERVRLVGLLAIMALSLSLLAYVGFGEALRTYQRLELERLAAQGETVQTAMSTFLQAGFAVDDYPGFVPLTQPLLDSDATIASIEVIGVDGKVLHANGESRPGIGEALAGATGDGRMRTTELGDRYVVALELRNKFEKVGDLVLTMPKAAVTATISAAFQAYVLPAGLALMVAFAIGVLVLTRRAHGMKARGLELLYGATFFLLAAVVIVALTTIYAQGIRHKVEALGSSLAERLDAAAVLGLDLEDFSHVDSLFAEYQRANPELSYIALTRGDEVVMHTDAGRVGRGWESPAGQYEYAAPLSAGATVVRTAIPQSVITEKLWRSVKNFFVLFIATGLLAGLFFSTLNTLVEMPAPARATPYERRAFQSHVIQPLLFMAMFVEALANSFLPQHLQRLARDGGLAPSVTSLQFTCYFAALALALLPVGGLIQRGKMKQVLVGAVLLELVSLVLMATVASPWAMFAVRAMAGAAHGMIATGVQGHMLLLAAREQQTHGASRFLLMYNSGMISGTAIGALLAVYMGVSGVFALAAVLAFAVLLYAVVLLPSVRPDDLPQETSAPAAAVPGLGSQLGHALRDGAFVRAVGFVGIPAKIVNAGLAVFALPLLLAAQALPQEDIGQVLMFYPIGILIMSINVTRVVRWLGDVHTLFWGTLAGGLGVAAVGLLGVQVGTGALGGFGVPLLVLAMFTLGLAHGMINAPIVAYVANSSAARVLGRGGVNSLYRFTERVGHMLGPILVSQLAFRSSNSQLLAWIAVPIIALGLWFYWSARRPTAALAPTAG